MTDLTGQAVLITGASRGIGAAQRGEIGVGVNNDRQPLGLAHAPAVVSRRSQAIFR